MKFRSDLSIHFDNKDINEIKTEINTKLYNLGKKRSGWVEFGNQFGVHNAGKSEAKRKIKEIESKMTQLEQARDQLVSSKGLL